MALAFIYFALGIMAGASENLAVIGLFALFVWYIQFFGFRTSS